MSRYSVRVGIGQALDMLSSLALRAALATNPVERSHLRTQLDELILRLGPMAGYRKVADDLDTINNALLKSLAQYEKSSPEKQVSIAISFIENTIKKGEVLKQIERES